jgi:hypothetical protein
MEAPFLNRPSLGVGLRVPSGAIPIDTPSRSFSTTGASASFACPVFPRST